MKKFLYFIFLLAELFVGALLMWSLWDSSLYIPIVAAAALLVAALVWQGILYFKAADENAKRKIMIHIALAMLIPVAVFAVTYIVVAFAFIVAFV